MPTPFQRRTFLPLTLALLCSASWAQEKYPAKPVTVVVPQAAGGANDAIARIVAQKLTELSGQSFVVENRPGAGTMLASQEVATAQPDGHTLLMITSSHAINAAVRKTLEDPAVKKRIEETGSLVIGNTPEQFAAQIKAEFEVYKKVVDSAKLRLE